MALGHPIGVRAPCWLGNPKGTAFPWRWFPKAAALPWREASNGGQALRGRKNPMKPEVSWHTTLFAKSSVLYLLRPLTLERGCWLSEHTISGGCRTGGFWRATRFKFRICHSDKIRLFGCRWCCAVKRILKKSSERSCVTGGAEGISHSRPAAAPVSFSGRYPRPKR